MTTCTLSFSSVYRFSLLCFFVLVLVLTSCFLQIFQVSRGSPTQMIKESVTFMMVSTYSAAGTVGAFGDDSFCAFLRDECQSLLSTQRNENGVHHGRLQRSR